MSATTVTGLGELRRAARLLPETARATSRRVQRRSAQRIAADAKARLRAETEGTGKTAAAIVVRESMSGGSVSTTVEVEPIPGRDPKVPIYLEHGTVNMKARPFFGPAINDERTPHADEMERETERALKSLFGDA